MGAEEEEEEDMDEDQQDDDDREEGDNEGGEEEDVEMDDGESEEAIPGAFALAILSRVPSGALAKWCASNRGAFVVHALLQVPTVEAQVRSALQSQTKAIGSRAKSSNGSKLLLALLKGKA